MSTLHIQNATLAYHHQVIFQHLNLTLPNSKWCALLGPSGIGKTSLLRMIAGLTTHAEQTDGQIYTDNGEPVATQIAYMAQQDLLLPWLTVFENATLTLKFCPHHPSQALAIKQQAYALLEEVGLTAAIHLYPKQLSGGMRQRVALVRTLLANKPIVLMDEPFSALDAITRHKLQALAADLLRHKTVIFITHDPTEALRLAHDIYLLQGQPASLSLVTSLASATPRALTHPDVLQSQSRLFTQLSTLAGEAC